MTDPVISSFANLALTAERAFQRMFGAMQRAVEMDNMRAGRPPDYVLTLDDFKNPDDFHFHPGDPDS